MICTRCRWVDDHVDETVINMKPWLLQSALSFCTESHDASACRELSEGVKPKLQQLGAALARQDWDTALQIQV